MHIYVSAYNMCVNVFIRCAIAFWKWLPMIGCFMRLAETVDCNASTTFSKPQNRKKQRGKLCRLVYVFTTLGRQNWDAGPIFHLAQALLKVEFVKGVGTGDPHRFCLFHKEVKFGPPFCTKIGPLWSTAMKCRGRAHKPKHGFFGENCIAQISLRLVLYQISLRKNGNQNWHHNWNKHQAASSFCRLSTVMAFLVFSIPNGKNPPSLDLWFRLSVLPLWLLDLGPKIWLLYQTSTSETLCSVMFHNKKCSGCFTTKLGFKSFFSHFFKFSHFSELNTTKTRGLTSETC